MHSERPRFDYLKFNLQSRRGAGTPIRPPASPIFANADPLRILTRLQPPAGKNVYTLLMEEADKDRNDKWLPPARFTHDF